MKTRDCRRPLGVATLLVCVLLSSGQARALVGGAAAVHNEYPSVFIWTTPAEDIMSSYCTATKISPSLLLTAAHCVLEQTPTKNGAGKWRHNPLIVPDKELLYSFDRNLAQAPSIERLKINAVLLPPLLQECMNKPKNERTSCMRLRAPVPDIAIVKVENPQGTFKQAPIARVNLAYVFSGQTVTIMGYGAQDEDNTDFRPMLKFHRSRVATPPELETALIGTEAEIDGKPSLLDFFGVLGSLYGPRYANLGSGDSGGPVFSTNNTSEVVGVNSDGYCPKENLECQRTTNSFFARIHKGPPHFVGDWLEQIIQQ